ncbi:pyridoxal phosphate-dependent aminotransferase [Bacteriovoracales bacterium]|nr:pyridoxal phosphate-dependent aminotransferase [Bacteriovoracales bacterium]
MNLSKRVNSITPSKSIEFSSKVTLLKSQGKKILELNVGETDFKTPLPILEATQKALMENKTRYSPVDGIPELRDKIAENYNKFNQNISKDHVFIGSGSKHILYNIFQVICDDDDEVIIPSPYWVTFPETVKLAGGKPIFVDTIRHQLDLTKIEKAITKKTKAILINSPNNPTGAVYPKEDLSELVHLAKKYDLFIISDEAYEKITYDSIEHSSISTLSEEAFKRTLTVQTFSKAYSMTGFRIGYLIAPLEIVNAIKKLQGHLSGNPCTFAQYGPIAALEMKKEELQENLLKLQRRRDLAYSLFSQIFDCQKPQGGLFLFLRIKKGSFSSCEEMAEYILNNAGVALLPGKAFGVKNYLRLSFATSEETIKEAFKKIKEIL